MCACECLCALEAHTHTRVGRFVIRKSASGAQSYHACRMDARGTGTHRWMDVWWTCNQVEFLRFAAGRRIVRVRMRCVRSSFTILTLSLCVGNWWSVGVFAHEHGIVTDWWMLGAYFWNIFLETYFRLNSWNVMEAQMPINGNVSALSGKTVFNVNNCSSKHPPTIFFCEF